MMEQQFLVRLLSGNTRCVRFNEAPVRCCDLKCRIHEIAGIPPHIQRIATGTREVGDEEFIQCSNVPHLTVLLRLRGGKGGFGSLLRGAATKAGQKKTNNFDACRDMSGRRLRHVNGEKKVKEWHDEAKLRELEKVALDYVKKEGHKKKRESTNVDDLKNYREQVEKNAAGVQEAIMDGLKRGKKNKKKKEVITEETLSKKPRMIAAEDVSDFDDDDELFSQDTPGASTSNHVIDSTNASPPTLEPVEEKPEGESVQLTELVQEESENEVVEELPEVIDEEPQLPEVIDEEPQDTAENSKGEPPAELAELNLKDYRSFHDLEPLGLDRLKSELQKRGLKCGGNLSDRAYRLFLLKSTPLEKLDKKHFANRRS